MLCHIYHGAKEPLLSLAGSVRGVITSMVHLDHVGVWGIDRDTWLYKGSKWEVVCAWGGGAGAVHWSRQPLRMTVIKVQGGAGGAQQRAPCHVSHWLSTGRWRSAARCLEQSPQIVGLRLDNLPGFNGSQICLPSECTSQSHLAIVLPSNAIIELEWAFWSMTSLVKLIYSISTTTLSLAKSIRACTCVRVHVVACTRSCTSVNSRRRCVARSSWTSGQHGLDPCSYLFISLRVRRLRAGSSLAACPLVYLRAKRLGSNTTMRLMW